MNDPRHLLNNQDERESPSRPDHQFSDGTENFYQGSEPFFSFFMQAQVVLGAVRLTLQDQVVVQTSDLGCQMESIRRSFLHSGNLTTATRDILRVVAQFNQRVQIWEREVQNRSRDNRGKSGNLIQRIKAEIARVRSKVRTVDRTLVKLETRLHQLAGEALGQGQSVTTTDADDERVQQESARQDSLDRPTEVPGNQPPADSREFEIPSPLYTIVERLLGKGLLLRRDDATRTPVSSSNHLAWERAWDPGLAMFLAASWSIITGHDAKSAHGESHADRATLTIWLIAKNARLAKLVDRHAAKLVFRLASNTHSIVIRETSPTIITGFDANLPQAQSTRKFIDRIIQKRFAGDPASLRLLVAEFKDIALTSTGHTLRIGRKITSP